MEDAESKSKEPAACLTFRGQAGFFGLIATVFSLPIPVVLFFVLHSVLGGDTTEELPQNGPLQGTVLFLVFLLLAAFCWRLAWFRMRPLLRVGREGIEANLGVAIIRDAPTRWLAAFGLLRCKSGWIPWYEVRSMEARAKVTEFAARQGVNGGLVIEGTILPKRGDSPNPAGVPLGTSLAIITMEFPSTPVRVAEKIRPYLDDPELRKTLSSLFES